MNRAEIGETVSRGNPLRAVNEASVQVNIRGGGAATLYSAATGAGTVANPTPTDAQGRINAWVDEGSYDLVVTYPDHDPETQRFEATVGATTATWRTFRNPTFPFMAAAAPIGQYIDTIAVGTAIAAAPAILDPAVGKGTEFRFGAKFFFGGGAADPSSSTVRLSVYPVTLGGGAGAGPVYALGTEIAASVVEQAAPVRGVLYSLVSAAFALPAGSIYAVVGEVKVAAIPASVGIRGFLDVMVRG